MFLILPTIEGRILTPGGGEGRRRRGGYILLPIFLRWEEILSARKLT